MSILKYRVTWANRLTGYKGKGQSVSSKASAEKLAEELNERCPWVYHFVVRDEEDDLESNSEDDIANNSNEL